ncbi:MAG: hypothetical protein K2Q01_01255 [Rickettsiales bacterium]|nr:hypothetical protein [Rickettsiales bacterium]
MGLSKIFRRERKPIDPETLRRKQHDMADAIRDIITPEYLADLKHLAYASGSSRLLAITEQAELILQRGANGAPEMSDQQVVNTTQQLVGILNSIGDSRLRLNRIGPQGLNGPHAEVEADLGGGMTMSD